MAMVNAFDPTTDSHLSPEDQRLLARRQHALGPAYRLFYQNPIHLVRGEGVWVYDNEGRKYLDAYNNVCSVGHCHPQVVNAISKQLSTLNTHTRYLDEGIVAYAERLLATMPADGPAQMMFTCTGSEANDLALRLARDFTGRSGVITTANAYHGITESVSEVSPSLGMLGPRSPRVRFIPWPDSQEIGPEERAKRLEQDLISAIAHMRKAGIEPAAFIADTVFSSDGLYPDPAGFLKPALDLLKREGVLFIADEVQAGFARTGEQFWGFARHGVSPDIVTMGKPMGNGFPLAGLALRPEIVANFGKHTRYFNTFGGSPVACAAGMAVLDVMENEGLQQNAVEIGNFLKEGLCEIVKGRDDVAQVRGVGMFLAAECVTGDGRPSPELATRIVNDLRKRRVLISAIGPNANILKIRPPLVFFKEHAEYFLDAMQATFSNN